jgi:16S rRNA processing protein RimM
MKNKIPIAKIGKTYGIKGWQKIHLLTDFPEQFKPNTTFESDKINLTIEKIDLKRKLVKFKGIDTPEDAKKLTNRMLYTTEEQTKENIKLKENEYFWFDIIGCDVIENGEWRMENGECLKGEIKLGKVKDIERVDVDYLVIDTDEKLINQGYPKRFLIDFKRHVKDVDVSNKKITANAALELLDSLL